MDRRAEPVVESAQHRILERISNTGPWARVPRVRRGRSAARVDANGQRQTTSHAAREFDWAASNEHVSEAWSRVSLAAREHTARRVGDCFNRPALRGGDAAGSARAASARPAAAPRVPAARKATRVRGGPRRAARRARGGPRPEWAAAVARRRARARDSSRDFRAVTRPRCDERPRASRR